jgi:hypothetical protein
VPGSRVTAAYVTRNIKGGSYTYRVDASEDYIVVTSDFIW